VPQSHNVEGVLRCWSTLAPGYTKIPVFVADEDVVGQHGHVTSATSTNEHAQQYTSLHVTSNHQVQTQMQLQT